MSYGVRFFNDDLYVQIDSDTPRLCALANGIYEAVGSHTAVVTFFAPITTPEPPCIFIRNAPDRPDDMYDQMYIRGSAGNWTGFEIRANNVDWRPKGKWFAAVFASAPLSSYGLRLWDANGVQLFDSGATPIIVTKANSDWTYQGEVTPTPLGSRFFWSNGSYAPIDTDEYFLMNPFSRGAVNLNASYHWRAVRFNYSTNNLEMFIIGPRQNPPQLNQGQITALFARLPGT